jgi:DNA-binding CsgD family transcriptional regulator
MVLTHYGRELVLPIALERSARSGAFLPGEVRRMNLLMALLKPAAELTLKVGLAAARSLADGLSAPGRDTALLAPSGRIIHQAPGFARHLGADLAVRAGHLRSSHPAADRRLLAAIGKCVQPGPVVSRIAGPVALPRRGRRPLIAQVAPIAGVGQDMLMLARAALILTDPDAGVPLDRIAVSLAAQGLTEAETRLARRIGLGESLATVAVEERITIETARSRLKAVFHKTGTHRQAELAAFVMRLAR